MFTIAMVVLVCLLAPHTGAAAAYQYRSMICSKGALLALQPLSNTGSSLLGNDAYMELYTGPLKAVSQASSRANPVIVFNEKEVAFSAGEYYGHLHSESTGLQTNINIESGMEFTIKLTGDKLICRLEGPAVAQIGQANFSFSSKHNNWRASSNTFGSGTKAVSK